MTKCNTILLSHSPYTNPTLRCRIRVWIEIIAHTWILFILLYIHISLSPLSQVTYIPVHGIYIHSHIQGLPIHISPNTSYMGYTYTHIYRVYLYTYLQILLTEGRFPHRSYRIRSHYLWLSLSLFISLSLPDNIVTMYIAYIVYIYK